MPKRRRTIKVVVDTNVFVGNFLTRSRGSQNRRVIRLWLVERKFKLALSSDIEAEYLRIFEDLLGFDTDTLDDRAYYANRFPAAISISNGFLALVGAGRRSILSRTSSGRSPKQG